MNDYDKVKKMFIELGIEFEELDEPEKSIKELVVIAKTDDSTSGDYFTESMLFVFNIHSGDFVKVGLWE